MKPFSHKLRSRFACIATLLFISGCATQPPLPVTTAPASSPSVAAVQADPARFKGEVVRWGGVITRVENQPSQTSIELVSHALKKSGEPMAESGSSGRFIAVLPGFVDPVIYSSGRLLTVVGTLGELTTRPIGDYNYTFPVVAVTAAHLWPVVEEITPADYPPPWWYYDPWPYYPRPYPRYPRYHW